MTFDITGFQKELIRRIDSYMLEVLEEITKNNPNLIESLKKDSDLFNTDGSPKTDMTKEQVDEKVKAILVSPSFNQYKLNKQDLYNRFSISPEDLDKFIVE